MSATFTKAVKIFVVASFVIYFTTTFIFCLPDSCLPKSLVASKAKFQVIFYQKWGFFKYSAPHNDRLYYTIQNKETGKEIASVEVLEKLRKQKTAKAPFNQKEITTDIILSRCIAELLAIEPTQIDTRGKEVLQTLKNYAEIVAANNNIDTANNIFRLKITQKYFNDFGAREMTDPEKEVTVFETSYNHF